VEAVFFDAEAAGVETSAWGPDGGVREAPLGWSPSRRQKASLAKGKGAGIEQTFFNETH